VLNSSIDITMGSLFNRKSFSLTDLMSGTTEIKDDDVMDDNSEICVGR